MEQAVNDFISTVALRGSYLIDVTNDKPVDVVEIHAKIARSRLSVFDERCKQTNRRKATWTYDRHVGKPMLNRLFLSKNAKDKLTRRTGV